MENFKEALIQFSQSNPNLFPNDADNSYPMLIEKCFHQFFADFQTPDHPTYSAMIYRAIWELNKKGGSSEKSISKFIKKEYADLPWAHSTLLKHHLQKLCDRNEICMTHKQCYLLAGAESELEKKNSRPSKKRKKQKSRLGSEAGKIISSPLKKDNKKKICLLDIQESSVKEQRGLHKRKRKQRLKSKTKSSKKKHTKNEEIKLQLKEASLKQDDDDLRVQKEMLEVNRGEIQIQEQNEMGQESHHDNSGVKEQIGLNRRKRKHRLKSKRKSSKHVKKHAISEEIKLQLNEANLRQVDEDSCEQVKFVVNRADIQIQEQNEMGQESHHDNSGVKEQLGLNKRKKQGLKSKRKSSMHVKKHSINQEIKIQVNEENLKQINDDTHNTKEVGQESPHDDSGHVNLEQIHTKKNPELLQPEESPDSNLVSHGNVKRVWTRSQLKTISKKDASDKAAMVDNLSNEEQQISRSPSSEKPLVELLMSISSKVTKLPDDEPTTGHRSTEKSTVEDKPKYKRRGRHLKPIKPEKDDVFRNSKSAAILRRSQKSTKKGKVVNKKVQPKQKRNVGHTMTRRSSSKPSN